MSSFCLLLGTKNPGKVKEAKEILSFPGENLQILSFRERNFADVDESGETYADNSLKKARYISQETGLPVLSDDSGLEVFSLNGAPGPRSARFAGPGSTDEENLHLLLDKLKGVDDRGARFVTVATLYLTSEERYMTRGTLRGSISREARGESGFGYDPIFVPDGFDKTLAQLRERKKNEISHRRKALEKMRDKLKELSRRA
ncbi:RdgB/HAM1 family non-canonical purine NTP pyrophosphatase [Candidatus Bipolaricaulota bacterium]|nr:RdgB/HAM1 family non-canonical purine NTP pyrophosphatase [Candidatus Bipolaricaulota bacterium]